MIPLKRKSDPYQLVVGMTGVSLGDRIVQIGCAHGGRLGAIAGKVGLSGHAAAVVPDATSADRARKGAEQAGVFVEIQNAPPTRLPLDTGSFDLAIVDDTGGFFGEMSDDDRAGTVREMARVLRPGGRAMVIGALPARGVASIFARGARTPSIDPTPALEANGFKLTRVLGESEGLRFIEGLKPRG